MKLKCDNCGHEDVENNLPDVKYLVSRLEIGGMFTYKECPKCKALCFPIDKPNRHEAIKEAYTRLWNAVENGKVKEDFFKLREDFRNTIQS